MSTNLSELEHLKFQSKLSVDQEHSPKLNKHLAQNPNLSVTVAVTSSFFKELSKAKDCYQDFRYIDILNSQLEAFQLKYTERLERRLESKTIHVLWLYRKITGSRKRKAFDSTVHKLAIFSDELENVKKLNYTLQKFQIENLDFDQRCFDLHEKLRSEIVEKNILVEKKQCLIKQLGIVTYENENLLNYVKILHKRVATPNSGKEFTEISDNNKSRKIREFKSKAETALWFAESYGLVPQYIKLQSSIGEAFKVDFQPTDYNKSSFQDLPDEEKQKIKDLLFILEKFNVSESAYRELILYCDLLPRKYLISWC